MVTSNKTKSVLRGDLPRLSRTTSIVTSTPSASGTGPNVKRSKPLKYAYEKEIVLYAHHNRLDYFSTECIYSPEAFRGSARALVKNLERVRPSSILDIVRSGEDMARLVPGSQAAAAAQAEEEEGGCGSAKGSGEGGSMVVVERLLAGNERAKREGLETDVAALGSSRPTVGPGGKQSGRCQPSSDRTTRVNNAAKTSAANKQVLKRCAKCGYLSSQDVCKACVLLDGLNKNRPKCEVASADAIG